MKNKKKAVVSKVAKFRATIGSFGLGVITYVATRAVGNELIPYADKLVDMVKHFF